MGGTPVSGGNVGNAAATAAVVFVAEGATKLPSGFWRSAQERFSCRTSGSSAYPIAPGVSLTVATIAGLPDSLVALGAAGHVGEALVPTVAFQVAFACDRYPVKPRVVAHPPEQWTGVMRRSEGRCAVGFRPWIAELFQFVISPRNIAATTAPVRWSPVGAPGTLYATTVASNATGRTIAPAPSCEAWEEERGASMAAKSTALDASSPMPELALA